MIFDRSKETDSIILQTSQSEDLIWKYLKRNRLKGQSLYSSRSLYAQMRDNSSLSLVVNIEMEMRHAIVQLACVARPRV